MVQASDTITCPRSARDGRVQRCIHDALHLLERLELLKGAQALQEAQGARQGRLADAGSAQSAWSDASPIPRSPRHQVVYL